MAKIEKITGSKNTVGAAGAQSQTANSRRDFSFQNKSEDYYGVIKGISSNDKGYTCSSLDMYRNTFKYFVYFPKLKEHRFVIPREGKDVLFGKHGINEEAYRGLTVVVSSTSSTLPKYVKGDICTENIEKLKRKQLSYMGKNNINDPNSVLVKDTNPMISSVGFFTGAFNGVLSPESGWLLNCISKRKNYV